MYTYIFHVHSCRHHGDDPHILESKLAEVGKLRSSIESDRKVSSVMLNGGIAEMKTMLLIDEVVVG